MRQFLVIGLGRFGSSVATTLAQLGYEVMGVDSDESIIQDHSELLTYSVQADATDENALKALGARNFDVAIVSIGQNIQASILVTLILKEMGMKYLVAKAQNELHAKVLYKIGADRVVFPERDMGVRVAHNLVSSKILDFIELSPHFSIVELIAIPEWWGNSLKDLDMRKRYGLNVLAIKRNEDVVISPKADEKILKDDILVVVAENENIKNLEKHI